MTEADQLLLKLRRACAIVGRDPVGQLILQLVLDEADADRLMALGAHAGENKDGGDDSPYGERPVSVCWLELA
jgi:hypothetical protein